MTVPEHETTHYETHWEYFKDLLQTIRKIINERYRLSNVSIRPIGSNASRLSIPVKIVGVNDRGEKTLYFGKILGSSDLITARSIQLFKNVYLQMNSQDPIFGAQKSAEEMAREQYEMLGAILDAGVPTAKPYGYHPINDQLWLVVAEFLDAKPISASSTVTSAQMDSVFRYLKRMHRRGIFHGDIKPDNIMFGDKIYLLDVGRFRDGVPSSKKRAYDLACMICSFIECQPVDEIVMKARKYYSRRDLRAAAKYLDLVQRRPDINFTDETKDRLLRLMNR